MSPAPLLRRFIALEGPIGVGKTSLAGKLAATLGAELVLERAEHPGGAAVSAAPFAGHRNRGPT